METEIPIRIYYPDNKRDHPIILHFHGGAWILGSIETEDSVSRILANSCNCIVISVNYRLAPEHKFPAAVTDCFDSIKWTYENAESIGGHPNRIAVFGISAGGNLAAATSILSRDQGIKLRAQALVVPFVYLDLASTSMTEYRKGYFLDINVPIDYGIMMYIRDEKDLLNPMFVPLIAEDLSNLPQAIIVTAEYDPLRDQGEAYAKRLMEAGVLTLSFRVNGMVHGFLGSPNISRLVSVMVGSALKDILMRG
ncbi:alpha/beta hydrolase [Saccharolobus solfataricus]|uniref:Carboxylesterase (Est) n=2 Tax=Saccharolobus solfataricus TaxID=2287 RepID=Q97VU2_SACS2|nr:alpha/beta hydrolase [Saccharolobus solfataricus]AAK42648.1 Carboxylesterase (est) [Saccharolobus solfataricus P2]AKA72744.2 alpha/beta hydrolase [Saccharolobus solfataricus]AKA75443.2 alpha/beta hydrolase [Saccharolobus solfataricus]AKA78136.2 alpha/beta hydrolase [Saccharolobus solfataricus]AZF67255.1 alpha/beta hydrolase [Saccharolobus solfataricus]